ncbi:MAG: histidine kinase [Pseudomonadota bacterium]|nr:histidine kinase [Pseudomonadota bacterium]
MTGSAPGNHPLIVWPGVARHGVSVLLAAAAVALLTNAIWPQHGYFSQFLYALTIGVLTWLPIELGRHLVPQRLCHPSAQGHGWPRGWRGVLLVAAGIAVGYGVGEPLAAWWLGRGSVSTDDQWSSLLITLAAGSVVSFYFYARGKTAALAAQAAAAERDAAEARLRLLHSQLAPHMLFNTLANLRALISADPPAAQHMLDRLNAYLRATLHASRASTHPLAAEFERLRDYLALMAVRMGPRLQHQLDLPDALRNVPVPTLLLQPLVENAIQHGLEPQVAGGRLDVRAERAGPMLRLTVADTGVGFHPGAVREGRFGMAQVVERVASRSGGLGRVDVHSAPGAGTTVTLELPLNTELP